MGAYAAGQGCLMEYLQRALDDDDPGPCGRCSVCTGALPVPGRDPSAHAVAAARSYVRGQDVILEPRKLWPAGLDGRRGRIRPPGSPGRALAYADDPGWTDELAAFHAGDEPVSDELVAGLVEVLRRFKVVWPERPVAVVAMASRSHPRRVAAVARRIGEVGKLPVIEPFDWHGPAAPSDAASGARARGLLASLRLRDGVAIPPGPVLLVDDTTRTGWTLTVAADLLVDAGAGAVWPLVVHRLP